MPLPRRSIALSHFIRYAESSITQQPSTSFRKLSSTTFRFVQGYGSGEGHPMGEDPQQQGSSNETKQNLEHPGPAPPAEGQGKGAGPTKGRSKTKETRGDASESPERPRSKESNQTKPSPTGSPVGKSEGKRSGPQDNKEARKTPPIQGNIGAESNLVDSHEVEKHNKEFGEGYDRAPKAPGTREIDSKGRWID